MLFALIQIHNIQELEVTHINILKNFLSTNIYKNYELEVIWILFLLIKTNNVKKDDDVTFLILKSNNELAILMLLANNLIDSLILRSYFPTSWLLLYEFYAYDIIPEEIFTAKLELKNNLNLYKKLKVKNLHFCNFNY